MNRAKKILILGWFSWPWLLSPLTALAHCPLCTVGVGLVALGAYSIGVSGAVIGILVGAAALALGLWIGRLIKKQYLRRQAHILGALSWATTVLPLQPLFADYRSWYLSAGGQYGTLLNRTYAVNLFLIGAILGAVIMAATPKLSRAITEARGGKTIPYQGMVLTFTLLIITSLITQFAL